MSVMIEETKTIYDSNNKILLTIPNNTTLDFIIKDLWNDITKYLNKFPYVLARRDVAYYDYELDDIDDNIPYLYAFQGGWSSYDLCIMVPDI